MTDPQQTATDTVSLQDIVAAAERIRSTVRTTPLDPSPALSARIGAELRLKLESQQLTGSFKLRGATNVLASLTPEQRLTGVIAPTAGNHGLGLACAGHATGVPVSIYLPHAADPSKVATMRDFGARLTFFDDVEQARHAALAEAQRSGATFVSAYNHLGMVAGGGTVGLEILQQWADAEIILVNIGGGGLAAGIATAVKALNPAVQVWGIQSEASPTFARWMDAGDTVPVSLSPSVAEGVSGPIEASTLTWPLVRDRVDRVLTVSEAEIKAAMRTLLDVERQVAEPSGVPVLAGALRYAQEIAGRRTVAVISGRNVAGARYLSLLNDA